MRSRSTARRGATWISDPAASGLAQQTGALQRVGEDLQPADLIVAAEPPDMHDGQLGALVTLLDVRVAEHDDRVVVLKELVGRERELVPRPDGLLEDRDGRVLALVRAPTGHVFGVPSLPREVLRPVRQGGLEVSLRELLVALAQQVGLASHLRHPRCSERWLPEPP